MIRSPLSQTPLAQIAWCGPLAVLLALTQLSGRAAGQAELPLSAPRGHNLHHLRMPPGQIGQEQLLKERGLPGYFQPVEVRGPEGCQIAIAINGGYTPTQPDQLKAGLLIGRVYRYRVGSIPRLPGYEIYPTVEVVNRLYPPPGMEAKFPIPVELTREELEMAVEGRFVIRVIYLEDPNRAEPVQGGKRVQPLLDVDSAEDPLETADRLGRPMAILRMGSRVPLEGDAEPEFAYGMPPAQLYEELPPPPEAPGTAEDSAPPAPEAAPASPLSRRGAAAWPFAPQTPAFPWSPRR